MSICNTYAYCTSPNCVSPSFSSNRSQSADEDVLTDGRSCMLPLSTSKPRSLDAAGGLQRLCLGELRVAETTCQPGWDCDRSVTGGDGRRRGGGGGGAAVSIADSGASAGPWPPLPSTVSVVLGCDWATASALPLTARGGDNATNDLEIEGALSADAVFTASLGSM